MKWKAVLVWAIILPALSCNRQQADTSKRILSENQMIDIMTDVQIIEADINNCKAKGLNTDSLAIKFYHQLFEHYDITDSVFNESMRYYTLDPATLESIMDSVTNRLLKAQADSIH